MINFRELSEKEEEIFEEELEYWIGSSHSKNLKGKYSFIIAEGKWKELLLTNHYTINMFTENIIKNPYSIGISFGEFKKNAFLINLGALSILKKYTNKLIIISDEAEQLFLYKRSIIINSVIEISKQITKGDKAIIINQKKDALGIGELLIEPSEIGKQPKNEFIVRNIIDLGWFLRKGK